MTDRATLVIQGYVTELTVMGRASDYISVELPLSLLPELASRCPAQDVRLSDRGTVIISGYRVIDAEAVAQLDLPAGEAAIEVAAGMLPELAVAGI